MMTQHIPRLVLAGTGSGCGKTTLTCAILQALTNRGLKACAFKCGPDYIDPMFHSRIIGAKSANLDLFFFDQDTLRFLLAKNAAGCDVSIIEGVMGYYDGIGMADSRGSTCAVAQAVESPAVLVVNARGASLSVLAAVHGFLTFQPHLRRYSQSMLAGRLSAAGTGHRRAVRGTRPPAWLFAAPAGLRA